jgi:hypothetical protein
MPYPAVVKAKTRASKQPTFRVPATRPHSGRMSGGWSARLNGTSPDKDTVCGAGLCEAVESFVEVIARIDAKQLEEADRDRLRDLLKHLSSIRAETRADAMVRASAAAVEGVGRR